MSFKNFILLPIVVSSIYGYDDGDKFMFAGISNSYQKIKFTGFDAVTTSTLGIRLGLQDKKYRVMLKAARNFNSLKEVSLETDMLLNTVEINSVMLKPYVGASIGYFDHKKNDTYKSLFGIHAGGIINLDENWDLDISYTLKDKRDSSSMRSYEGVSVAFHYYF